MAGVRSELERLLWRRRGGAFTKAEALRAGYTEKQIRGLLRSGEWISLCRGTYVTSEKHTAAREDVDAMHLLQAEAVGLSYRNVVLSHGTAVSWHKLAHLRDIGDRPQATRPINSKAHQKTNEKVRLHTAWLPDGHIEAHAGIRVTTVARTVADIARELPLRDAIVIGDSALSQGKTTRAEIKAALATMKGWPGIGCARRVVELLDARSQSPLESLCRAAWIEGGLPLPELQVWVFTGRGFAGIVDGMWFDPYVAYEADGATKYRDSSHLDLNRQDVNSRDAKGKGDTLYAEKLRQEKVEFGGVVMRRYSWSQAYFEPAECVRRAREAVAEAARRPPPKVELWVGDRDTPAPDPFKFGPGRYFPDALGLRCIYDGLHTGRRNNMTD